MIRGEPASDAPVDLRLIPAALLSWLAVILGLTAGWAASAWVGLVAALVTLFAGIRVIRAASCRVASGVLAAAGCVTAASVVITAVAYQL
ncbi:MAG TPA: hypothetical protein VK735_39065, partial [Pseudonocardia sp.]|uniref:hypothetical protein n=1 Tax=Pseudonocardia sp. TaxID=60912 RepID=UPI002C7C152D|nr:hypothetical protein [Pseudonocardia sp.]